MIQPLNNQACTYLGLSLEMDCLKAFLYKYGYIYVFCIFQFNLYRHVNIEFC